MARLVGLKFKNMTAIIIILIIIVPLAALWVRGIDYMSNNHPDYKGNDLFGEFDEDDKHYTL
jgi:hypothetical protein